MEKRKAFTLIELMGVLVIIGILTVILVPVINNTIKNNKQTLYDNQLEMIRLAAQNLATDNTYILPEEDGEEIYITLGQLRAMGYAEGTIIDPLTNENFSDNLIVMIIKKGNDYDYVINLDGDVTIVDSDIQVAKPSRKYINKGKNSFYIITVKPDSETEEEKNKNTLGYYTNIGKENIKLLGVGETDEKVRYKLDGSNGLYKLTVLGGDKNGYLYFSLNNLKDYEGKEIDVSTTNNDINSNKKIIVDNTAPQISFTTNGTSVWAKSVATKIQVTDNNGNDALDDSTYKYVYSLLNKEEQDLTSTYNLSDEVIKNKDDGEYYLIAKACDKAGNCKTEVSNKFLVDNTPPTCNWSGENTTWKNSPVSIILIGIDNHEMNSSKTTYTRTYNESGIELEKDNLSFDVEDEAGNVTKCSKIVNVYYDKKKPVITSIDNPTKGNWVNYDFSVKLNTTEKGSGLQDVYYSYPSKPEWTKEEASIDGNIVTSTPFSAERNELAYFNVCDRAGNCSEQASTQIRIDKTAPTVQILTSLENHTNEKLGKQRKVTLIVSDNEKGSGLNKDSVCTYSHSVASGVGSFKIGHWPDEEDSKKYYAGFGYSGNSNNTLTVNCKITDVASNITNFKFHCNYGEKKCYKD